MNLFDEGMSYSQIAKEIERGASTVSSFLKSTGRLTTKSESKRRRIPQERRDQAAALYIAGDSITTVARKTGLSRDIIWGEIKRRGISRSPSDAQKMRKVND
jgi:transposase-like protein